MNDSLPTSNKGPKDVFQWLADCMTTPCPDDDVTENADGEEGDD